MGILIISIVFSLVIFFLIYASVPSMQSEEWKEADKEEVEIWERW